MGIRGLQIELNRQLNTQDCIIQNQEVSLSPRQKICTLNEGVTGVSMSQIQGK